MSHADMMARAIACQCGICEACVYAERWGRAVHEHAERAARRVNYRDVPEGATAGRPKVAPAANESDACLEAFDRWVSANIVGQPSERQLHHMWLAWQGCWVLFAREREYEAALYRIQQWAEAYPLDVFPEPDWKRSQEVLEAAGLSLSRISAANMRHVITRAKEIVDAALKS